MEKLLVTRLTSSMTHRDHIETGIHEPNSLSEAVREKGKRNPWCIPQSQSHPDNADDLFSPGDFTACWARWAFQQRRRASRWGKRPWTRRAECGPEPWQQISTPLPPARWNEIRRQGNHGFWFRFRALCLIISWRLCRDFMRSTIHAAKQKVILCMFTQLSWNGFLSLF